MNASSDKILGIMEVANKALAASKEYKEVMFVFLEEDNPVSNLLAGKFTYRAIAIDETINNSTSRGIKSN